MERFAAGSTAGAIAQTAIYPMEVELIFFFSVYIIFVTEKYYHQY